MTSPCPYCNQEITIPAPEETSISDSIPQIPASAPKSDNEAEAAIVQPKKKGRGHIVCGCLVVILMLVIGVSIFIRIGLREASEKAQDISCWSNLKELGLGLRMFSDDHHDLFPKADECRDLLLKGSYINDAKCFSCPCGEEYRLLVNGENAYKIENPSYYIIAVCPHKHRKDGKMNVLFADGHVGCVDKDACMAAQTTQVKNAPSLPADKEEARIKELRSKAEKGDGEAQFSLGVCYMNGDGVQQNMAEAVKWYRKAAEQGYADAQNNLGVCYEDGNGVQKNMTEAVKWYRKAAEQGHIVAQFNLGGCYKDGNGVQKDMAEAVKWYRKAADQGLANAQNELGYCYYEGNGVQKNMTEAVKWIRKAAEQGHIVAQRNLGFCYENGNGVQKDMAEAVRFYRMSAEQGYALAQFELGVCYENGSGVTKDLVEAGKWYSKAAEQGNADAQYRLRNLPRNGSNWHLKTK